MKILNLPQGSPAWIAHRAKHFNASDAPAMLGCSPYKSCSQLLREHATGLVSDVDAATQRRFDDGHRFEALARPLAEAIIEDDLYPVVGSLGRYSASFDGLTLDQSTAFEHKTLSASLRDVMHADVKGFELPLHYQVQMEQQCMVSGATRVLFMASSWNREELYDERHCWYYPNPELRARIVAGWAQFAIDLDAYVLPDVATPAVAAIVESLPAVSVRMDGSLSVRSNLPAFGAALKTFVEKIPAKPSTDQEFADTEAACKALKRAEEALESAESGALASMADVESMRRMVADFKNLARATRLASEKMVEARKQAIRTEIVLAAQRELDAHIAALNTRLGATWMPRIDAGFAEAIKGKKTVASIKEGAGVALANAKIEANAIADRLEANRKVLQDPATLTDWIALFADFATVGALAPEAFHAVAAHRISTHKAAEAARAAVVVAAPAPAPSPVAVPTIAAAPAPAASGEPATLNAGALCKRLGMVLTVDFIVNELHVPPASTDRRATLWTERQFQAICSRVQAHVAAVAQQHQAEAVAA